MENTMSETTGLKHTRHCIECNVSLDETNWYPSFVGKKHYKCKTCYDERRILNRYKKRYGDSRTSLAKFIAHTNKKKFDTVKEVSIYIIFNPSFPGWCKVGMAVDAEDRLKQYQTSSPYRDYQLIKAYDTDDRRTAEKNAHDILSQTHQRRGEWFCIQHPAATKILDKLFSKGVQCELF